ncbi:anti-sigma factor domain-containing protein [Gorillibacterium sp. sgz5001074]|uniref:anti-sigma factor domain-containing protein n=1 Tax=Gorillibacterium sp. sgz5001074 TaxID=3446695 RepID=UPI003F676FAE
MPNQPMNPCELLLDYLSDEGSMEEKRMFERHLECCPSCRQELVEMKEVWSIMPLDLDEVEVPADLKDQVMGRIFVESPPMRPLRPKPARETAGRGWRSAFLATAAVCIVLALFLTSPVLPFGPAPGGTNGLSVVKPEPAQVLRTLSLRSTDTAKPNCGGTVWHTRKDDVEEVVVSLHGLSPTQGTEAYQVWLIHQGVRHNGGTLIVNDQGEGVLIYRVQKDDPPFEAVGVTLEPDGQGTQPRGRKVLGT